MARKTFNFALVFFMIIAFFGCAAHQPDQCFKAEDLSGQVAPDLSNRKADNFLVLIDSSESMTKKEFFGAKSNFDIGWNLISNMNQTIPEELNLMGTLRIVGGPYCAFAPKSTLVYGPEKYSAELFKEAMEEVNFPEAVTPLGMGIKDAGNDLGYAQGSVAFILISDGENTDGDPIAMVKQLKGMFGDQITVYTVLVGQNSAGTALMEEIAAIGGGFATTVGSLNDAAGVADFVQKIFLN